MEEEEITRKPRFTEEELGLNPLAARLVLVAINKTFQGQYVYDRVEGITVPNESLVERDGFTKLFLSSERRMTYALLGRASKELLGWMQYELSPGKDYLWLNRKRFMAENRIGAINTVRAAISDLVAHGFIAPTIKSSVYWINPHHFFCGNRLNKYPKNIIEYKPRP